jgi:uncharacterized protein YjbJ (UPF0337 family)
MPYNLYDSLNTTFPDPTKAIDLNVGGANNYNINVNSAGVSNANSNVLPIQPKLSNIKQPSFNNFASVLPKDGGGNMAAKALDMVVPGLGTAVQLINGKKKELVQGAVNGITYASNRYSEKSQRIENQYKVKTDYSQYVPTYRDTYDYNFMNEGVYQNGGKKYSWGDNPTKLNTPQGVGGENQEEPKQDSNTYAWQQEPQTVQDTESTKEEIDDDDLMFEVDDNTKSRLKYKKEYKLSQYQINSKLDVNDTGVTNATPNQYLSRFNNYQGSVKDKIGKIESDNNYTAKNSQSSAYGKYQFLKSWNPESQKVLHKNINQLNPQEQEQFMDYVVENNYRPKAKRLTSKLNMSEDEVIALIHFRGEGYVNSLANQ